MRSKCLSCWNFYVRQDLISGHSLHCTEREIHPKGFLGRAGQPSPAQSRAQPSPKLGSGIPCPSLAGDAEVPWAGVELAGISVELLCLRHKSSEILIFWRIFHPED